MKVYEFQHSDLPFQLSTGLRFICKSAVARRQYAQGERVEFSDKTIVKIIVPSDDSILPYLSCTCPVSGSTLRINIQIQPERALLEFNDAKAYLRRILCIEAVSVSQRDLANVLRHGPRQHYTEDFFRDQIEKYQYRADTFHTYELGPQYD
uniref:Uncharacterized protein n=1 Tax=Pseudomonas phage RVTF4 TaxID=3236931 RepID=A0AB39CCA5_9VIRU